MPYLTCTSNLCSSMGTNSRLHHKWVMWELNYNHKQARSLTSQKQKTELLAAFQVYRTVQMGMSQLRPENQISVIMNSLFIWKLLEISRIISWNQEIRSCVHPVKQYLSQQETQKLLLRSQLDIQMWRDNCLYTKNHYTLKSIANALETQCHVNPCVRKWFCCPEVVFVTKGNCKWCPDDIYFCKKKNQRGPWHMISTGTSS